MTIHSQSTLAILGGAGKAGRPLVAAALAAGYQVRLLLRQPAYFDLTHERLVILQGDARTISCLRELMQGCQALVSTLGNPRDERMPMLSTVTGHLMPLMAETGLRRYVTVTSLYTTDSEQEHLTTKQASDYMHERFPDFMADRAVEYALLRASGLDWTYVRLPYLVSAPATGRVLTSLDHLPGQQITVADLADFLIGQLDGSQFVRKAPFVANAVAG